MPPKADSLQPDKTLAKLMAGFLPYIERRAHMTKSFGLEQDDIVQEGLVGLFAAVRTFQEGKGASFATYAYTCINNNINSALAAAGANKHLPLNTYVPIEDVGALVTDGALVADDLDLKEDFRALIEKIETTLSKKEKNVLWLSVSGRSCSEIAHKLGTTEKSVENALFRARRKLRAKMP